MDVDSKLDVDVAVKNADVDLDMDVTFEMDITGIRKISKASNSDVTKSQ
jgi:hypothetical protein